MSDDKNFSVHSVIIEQCKKTNISGVEEVRGCDEETVVLETVKGTLTIKGEGLNIISFSKSSGELLMEGEVTALAYSGEDRGKGLFKRILK